MRDVFRQERRLAQLLRVEAALAEAEAELGMIPAEAAKAISSKALSGDVKLERVKQIEKEVKHDLAAVVYALAEQCGDHGKYVHFAATSSDILDTATALQMKEGLEEVERLALDLAGVLAEKARMYRSTLCVSRTHGMHALPYVFGLKFAVWLDELVRHIERIGEARKRALVGKMSGAVGTFAGMGKDGLRLQKLVMGKLGLGEPLVTTQVVSRDLHAEIVLLLSLISCSLDKIATEIRNLQRTEIGEVQEPFAEGQVGSSTMPHKRNPETCEKVSGIARVMRGLAVPAMEDVVLWHERDLTNSSSERNVLPEAFILLSEQLQSISRVLKGLEVNEERMLRNLGMGGGIALSEALFLSLVQKGMDRRRAHELVSRLAGESYRSKKPFSEIVRSDPGVAKLLSEPEIEACLDPKNYVGLAGELIDMVVGSADSRIQRAVKPPSRGRAS
ncbi:MAG: adenylosuccinate lyase [Candidatus Brockarchaeota archaeon]|nr:adenylosuccinate lyase [Candidatus Brockarchaeota archaeon]